MIYGSVCSGIEAATVAWHPLGWKPQWFSQFDPEHNYKNGPDFTSKVLADRFPGVINLGDMTKLHEREEFRGRSIELLVGGTPCQSFSIAGLRKGLADPRGNLALHFLKILDLKRPRWVVWENVSGVLSSWSDEAGSFQIDKERGFGDSDDGSGGDGGAGRFERGWQTSDFDTFLSGLREIGYGVAYRVLDAQFFGVPQRRRRVFVVGYFGDWRPAAAVLFERHGLSGNPPPSRKKRQRAAGLDQDSVGDGCEAEVPEVADTLRSGSSNPASHGKLNGTDRMTLVPEVKAARKLNHGEYIDDETAGTIKRRDYKDSTDLVAHTLTKRYDSSEDGTGRGTPLVAVEITGTLTSNGKAAGSATQQDAENGLLVSVFENHGQDSRIKEVDIAPQIKARAGTGGGNLPLVSAVGFEARVARNGRGAPDEIASPLKAQSGEDGRGDGSPLVAYTTKLENTQSNQSGKVYEEYAPRVSKNSAALMTSAEVRRLTPRECERLQGFPDDWTLVKYGKKLAVDGPRYKALGNSMAVPVMSWIGRRIQRVDDMLKELHG